MATVLSFGTWLLILIIKFYQLIISPILQPSCRFDPTCSQYGIKVLYQYGLVKGSWLILKRILKCHPLYDG
ncbi:Putative membrane protein insertion efficiency factor [Candidatus Arsenophonus lipoptenae]|uniref:Putative membrane protein insertion efficiency factor n=1 Tax=Candidatus Arsenophonus lipoptenae TaxID=634113 RepID=A0A0X9VMH6_9GAMM|nr:membrane protein insertion efficiency factor YidD [Candidatus Arsenophonus lipoptenae]AMA64926.1 Putative membrane protein insertion efficiency factor [Candidatus Arsenophonus lipoptenae]